MALCGADVQGGWNVRRIVRIEGDPLLPTHLCSTRRDGVAGAVLVDAAISVRPAKQVYTPEGPLVEIEMLGNIRLDWQKGDYLDTDAGEHYIIKQVDKRPTVIPIARLSCVYAEGGV